MFGTSLFGTSLFGVGTLLSVETYFGLFLYNGYNFETSDIKVTNIEGFDDLGSYTFSTYKTAREDGEGYINWLIDRKKITLRGVVQATTKEGLEANIESMKQALFKPNKTLWYRRMNGSMIWTTASCVGLKFDREHYHLTYVPFEVSFETLEPFFYASSVEETEFLAKAASFSETVDNLSGNYKTQPRIIVQFGTGISSVTTVTLTIGDDVLSVVAGYTDSDILIIDCKEKDASLNSVTEQEYTGVFPVLDIGTTSIELAIDGTWNADIYIQRNGTYV